MTTVQEVRDFFAWSAVPQPDTYVWNGEVRETGQTKWIRDDDGSYMGTRGPSAPHQHSQWIVDNLSLLTDSALEIVNFGELEHGRKAYVQVATEQVREVAGLAFKPMITATNSVDGSFATGYGRNVQVIVCLNTFAAARHESARAGADYRVKATKNSKFEVLVARSVLNIMFEDADDFGAEIQAWAGEPVSERRYEAFVERFAPLPQGKVWERGQKAAQTRAANKRERLLSLWREDPRVAPFAGTALGVVQAVNTYETHFAAVKNVSRENRNMLRTMKGEWAGIEDEALKVLAKV